MILRPILNIILFAVLFLLIVYAGSKIGFYPLPSYTFVIIPYMSLMTCGVFILVQKQQSQLLFSQAYIASIVFKILTGLGVILVLIRLDPGGANANAALFIVSYIVFTGVEVLSLLKHLNSRTR
jgi:hypothetical protein